MLVGVYKRKKITKQTRLNMSNGQRGRKQTLETIRKRVASRKWYKHSEATKRKIGKANSGDKGGSWKGKEVGKAALHEWVRKHLKKPKKCQRCKKVPPYDLANVSPHYNKKTYTRDLKNWKWLCRRCHLMTDGRMKEFLKTRRNWTNLRSKATIHREWLILQNKI